MQTDEIHLACSVDERMAVALEVMLLSLARQSSTRPITCHISTQPNPERQLRQLEDYLADRNIHLNFFEIIEREDYAVPDSIPKSVLNSLKIPSTLDHLQKLLLIDADTVFLKPVSDLFDTDLAGKTLGAVVDISLEHYCVYNNFLLEHYQASQYSKDYFEKVQTQMGYTPYLNAGVMLVDIQKWNSDRLTARCLRYLAERVPCAFNDQDALNSILKGDFLQLDTRWNSIALCCRDGIEQDADNAEYQAVRRQWREDPWIVHYAGPCKPWLPNQFSTDHDNLFHEIAATHEPTLARSHPVVGGRNGNLRRGWGARFLGAVSRRVWPQPRAS